jgi:membrane protease YdiL (CAAX protease family)
MASTQTPLRRIALGEVLTLTIVYAAGLWWLGPQLGLSLWLDTLYSLGAIALAVYFGVVSSVYVHDDAPPMRGLGPPRAGFIRLDNLRQALRNFAVPTVIGAIGIVGVVLVNHPHRFVQLDWSAVALKLTLYVVSALLQGLLVFAWLLPRLQDILPKSGNEHRDRLVVSVGLAVLFALSHLPNIPMILLTFAWGLVMGWLYQRTPNLYAAALCHALLGTLLHRVLALSMRIGPFYWESDQYILRTLLPFVREWINGRF